MVGRGGRPPSAGARRRRRAAGARPPGGARLRAAGPAGRGVAAVVHRSVHCGRSGHVAGAGPVRRRRRRGARGGLPGQRVPGAAAPTGRRRVRRAGRPDRAGPPGSGRLLHAAGTAAGAQPASGRVPRGDPRRGPLSPRGRVASAAGGGDIDGGGRWRRGRCHRGLPLDVGAPAPVERGDAGGRASGARPGVRDGGTGAHPRRRGGRLPRVVPAGGPAAVGVAAGEPDRSGSPAGRAGGEHAGHAGTVRHQPTRQRPGRRARADVPDLLAG